MCFTINNEIFKNVYFIFLTYLYVCLCMYVCMYVYIEHYNVRSDNIVYQLQVQKCQTQTPK